MTSDEREMLLEMPAVQELLREEREACINLCDKSAQDAVTKRRQDELSEWNIGWLDGWADAASSLGAAIHQRGRTP